jgi:hemin uptake protein HemP
MKNGGSFSGGAPELSGRTGVQPAQLSSRDLFRNANTVRIEHNGEHYWLRLTRGNKLILTK